MRARVLLFAMVLMSGCIRSHYRRSADRETYPIIAEREVFPTYDMGRTQVEPPPGSRLADPFNPDHPPKPPDDPAAAIFMARPNGMKGALGWKKDGVTRLIEPPGWQEALGLDASGTLKLDQDKAVEIALLDSREYQTALEGVYLAALSLTLNRFEFALHWFGTNATTYTHFGSGGAGTETNTLQSNSTQGFTREFAAGGQLMAEFANNVVFEYTGHTTLVQSNIILNFVQPLLRGFGRKVRLEALTEAERSVLYTVRDFVHFRKQFWAGIAIGGTTGAAAAGGGGGYLDLLLAVQTLRNSEANLKRQEETYRLYNELFRGGRASVVELDQFYTSFLGARQSVIDAQVLLQSALDSFKLRMGLPPRLSVELDDTALRQFLLADPSVEQLRDDVEAFQRERLKELDEPPSTAALLRHFDMVREYAERIPPTAQQAAADMDRWGRQFDRPARPDDDPRQRERDLAGFESLRKQLADVSTELPRLLAQIQRHRAAVTEQTRKAAWESLNVDIKSVLALVDTVFNAQNRARIYLIELPPVEINEADALAFAKENRLDLQNRLGAVTDAWRGIWVAANALRGGVNVVTNANIATDPATSQKAFDFAARASQFSVGLQFDAPLNRLAERNAYRASLITYQRAKRSYVELSDQIEFQIRQDLRQLNRLRIAFEIVRQQVLSASRQYESARLILLGPRAGRTANDSTTLNLLQALSTLLTARNALATNYINFEQQRIQLLLDLEALQLDQRGFPTNASSQPAADPASGNAGGPLPGTCSPGQSQPPNAASEDPNPAELAPPPRRLSEPVRSPGP
jgi:outer membrane protein TolC